MLIYVLLSGILFLIAVLLLCRWYSRAKVKSISKALKWIGLTFLAIVLVFFVFAGKFGWAIMTLPILVPLILRLRSAFNVYKMFSQMTGMGQNSSQPMMSNVQTETLEMSLNQHTGEMTGKIIKGPMIGRKIEELKREEIFEMLAYCKLQDEEGAQILESYLNRKFSDWQNFYRDPEDAEVNTRHENMSRAEALDVLGLTSEATDDEIKDSYHRLISQLHPDRGGSDYLAAKINHAKDVLAKK